jgi:hypothetical protein
VNNVLKLYPFPTKTDLLLDASGELLIAGNALKLANEVQAIAQTRYDAAKAAWDKLQEKAQ